MRELKLEELSTKQKLGMVTIATLFGFLTPEEQEAQLEYVIELAKNHSIGAVWINFDADHLEVAKAKIDRIKAVADYPILIMCDAESGFGKNIIGRHNPIGMVDSEEAAYTFGKVTAIGARQIGYNVVCNPVLDMAETRCACGTNIRGIGSDKKRVAELAVAEARGMHDGGILVLAKHYPGEGSDGSIDSHMAEAFSMKTKEELLDVNLYPYLALLREGLLDGIMTRHERFAKIDPDYPASLSQKVINLIRDEGFDGFSITDALAMDGIVSKFGKVRSVGLSVGNGNDISLAWNKDHREAYESMCQCYDEGIISDARLNDAVRHILEAQHKTLATPKFTEITEKDLADFDAINRDSVFAKVDEGLTVALPRDKKHYFVILTETTVDINNRIDVDTFSRDWYSPLAISDKLKELYPNSEFTMISQFPSASENMRVLGESYDCEDIVFITFFRSAAYLGREMFTPRIISLIEALQVTNRISTIVHFGNPYVFEDLPHIPRIINGTCSPINNLYTLDVLAGDYPAKGKLTYDVKFN